MRISFDNSRRFLFDVNTNGGTTKVSHGDGDGIVHSNENVEDQFVRFDPS